MPVRRALAHQVALPPLLASVAAACCSACDNEPRLSPAEETPSRQFILSGLSIEERRDGRILWVGTAERADGDLSVTDVRDVVMVRRPQKPSETEFTVRAPSGQLVLSEGKATFEDVVITDPGGATLTAGVAHYDEDAGRLTADGPLHFAARGMQADARAGIVHLEDGMVDVVGPVHGRYTKAEPGGMRK